jgi:hypothetical protein
MEKGPSLLFGIAQAPKGMGPFESYFFLFNSGQSPILNTTITKRGEFYYLVNQMAIASEFQQSPCLWWSVRSIAPNERKMKKTQGLEVRHLADKDVVLAEQGLPPKEPIRFILWLEIAYTEAVVCKRDILLCALEPDGVNLLPILTSEDPYQVISKRVKELM